MRLGVFESELLRKPAGDAHLFELRDLSCIKAISGETKHGALCVETAGNW